MTDDRTAQLEAQITQLQEKQDALYLQLAQAERERWKGYVDDLEVQLHLGAMQANDRVRELMEALRRAWADANHELDTKSSTATDVGAILRDGLQNAVRDVRRALVESQDKIRS